MGPPSQPSAETPGAGAAAPSRNLLAGFGSQGRHKGGDILMSSAGAEEGQGAGSQWGLQTGGMGEGLAQYGGAAEASRTLGSGQAPFEGGAGGVEGGMAGMAGTHMGAHAHGAQMGAPHAHAPSALQAPHGMGQYMVTASPAISPVLATPTALTPASGSPPVLDASMPPPPLPAFAARHNQQPTVSASGVESDPEGDMFMAWYARFCELRGMEGARRVAVSSQIQVDLGVLWREVGRQRVRAGMGGQVSMHRC